jgi:hypothetical protein
MNNNYYIIFSFELILVDQFYENFFTASIKNNTIDLVINLMM